jgi:hypothetical protein
MLESRITRVSAVGTSLPLATDYTTGKETGMIVFVQARQLVNEKAITYHTASNPAHSTKTHCGRLVSNYVRIQEFLVDIYGTRCAQCEKRDIN